MIPTDVALEWIGAYEFNLIDTSMNSRAMRDKERLTLNGHLFNMVLKRTLALL